MDRFTTNDITTTNQGTQSLGKAWDFKISGDDGDGMDLQDELSEQLRSEIQSDASRRMAKVQVRACTKAA